MGGKIILISSGDPDTGKVEEGDSLPVAGGLDIQAMIAQATEMLDEARGTVANMRSITGPLLPLTTATGYFRGSFTTKSWG